MYFFLWDCFLRLLFAFWWIRLRDLCKLPDGGMGDGKNSGGQNLAQESFSPIICCWVRLHPLPESYLAWGSSALGATVGLTGELQEGLCQGGPSWPNAASVPVPVVSPCWPTLHRRPSSTSRCFWFSLLWGHCSFPLGLGLQKTLLVHSKTGVSCFPQSCGRPIIKSLCPSKPWIWLWSSQSLCRIPRLGSLMWGSEPSQQLENFAITVLPFVRHSSGRYGIWFYHDCAPPTISLWHHLYLWLRGVFFWWVPASSRRGRASCSFAILVFSQEEMSTSFYFAILNRKSVVYDLFKVLLDSVC